MYRVMLTLTTTVAILTTASLMPSGVPAFPLGERAFIAKVYKQTDCSNGHGVDQCQFRSDYGQELRERRKRGKRSERYERERRERRGRFQHECC